MRYLAVTNNTTGETVMLTPAEADELTNVGADEIIWALEEFGICETPEHTIIDTRTDEQIIAGYGT